VIHRSAFMPGIGHSYARYSDDERHRYALTRCFNIFIKRRVTFVMLNPSTATETVSDPTVRRCERFARRWGFAWLEVVNLFSYRATNPRELYTVGAPAAGDPENWIAIEEAALRSELIVLAWGTHGALRDRSLAVAELLQPFALKVRCLGRTKEGFPKHPLYIAGDTPLEPFWRAA
jgi:hypothetical protein